MYASLQIEEEKFGKDAERIGTAVGTDGEKMQRRKRKAGKVKREEARSFFPFWIVFWLQVFRKEIQLTFFRSGPRSVSARAA